MTSQPERLALLAQGITIGGAIVAVVAMHRMAGGASILATPFSVWVLLPYVLIATTLSWRPSPLIGAAALAAAGVFGTVLYLDLIFPSSRIRSTTALAFLFIPLWQLGVYALAVVLSFVFGGKKRRSVSTPEFQARLRTVSPLVDVDAAPSVNMPTDAPRPLRCPRCGTEANFGASECRECEQPFGYPKS